MVGNKLDVAVFLSTPSARRATTIWRLHPQGHLFLSTPSARRATQLHHDSWMDAHDFYPRPPRGGRLVRDGPMLFCRKFLSTPSARRATERWSRYPAPQGFLSTPSARRATNDHNARIKEEQFLSTPSARRATTNKLAADLAQQISIHALREEGDMPRPVISSLVTDFYPRPPRGGRRGGSSACPA